MKVYENGKVFSTSTFLEYYNSLKETNKLNVHRKNIAAEIAKYVNKSEDAVKKWIGGDNGPSDYETVELLAKYFKVEVDKFLETPNKLERGGENINNTCVDIGNVYRSFVEAIETFRDTLAFSNEYLDSNLAWDPDLYIESANLRYIDEENKKTKKNYEQMRKELLIKIRNTRTFLKKEVVNRLESLALDIFDMDNEMRDDDIIRYVAITASGFYLALEEILKEYLP